jgi:uncharacterized membrane protein
MLVLFCGLAALVVDLGIARNLQRQAQNAADSRALGAAQFLAGVPNPTAAQVTQAKQLGTRRSPPTDGQPEPVPC